MNTKRASTTSDVKVLLCDQCAHNAKRKETNIQRLRTNRPHSNNMSLKKSSPSERYFKVRSSHLTRKHWHSISVH